MESGPDGKCLVNLQLELPTRSEPGLGNDVPIVDCGGEAPVLVHGGEAPVLGKQSVEHQENFFDRSGEDGRICRRQEYSRKSKRGGLRSSG